MKRILTVLIAALFVAGFAGIAEAVITGSAHDFSGDAWKADTEVCNICHAPHNGDSTDAPLWSKATSAATYTMYLSPTDTLDGVIDGAPSGISLLCLSCHDGTVALENYGGITTGTTNVGDVNAAADVGFDLGNDHPISITYVTGAGTEMQPTTNALGGGTVADVLDTANKVQCSSCHDVHNGAEALGIKLLRAVNTSSELCFACHDK